MIICYYLITVLLTITGKVEISRAKPANRIVFQNGGGYTNNNKTKTRILALPNSNKESIDQEIIFPDSFEAMVFDSVPKLIGPPKCAKDSTFCEDYEDYPYDGLKSILERTHVSQNLFAQDDPPNDITNRIGEENDDLFLCQSRDQLIFPKVGKNKYNKWKFIINQREDDGGGYRQAVRVEICRSTGTPCDIIGDLPFGYVTMCKQKYLYRRLMSLTDGGEPVPDTFLLPSACCCSYKREITFTARINKPPLFKSKNNTTSITAD